MSRAYDSDILVDAAGNALANAVITFYTDEAGTILVTDMFAAAAGGSPITTRITDAGARYEVFFATPKSYYVRVDDNSNTAYPINSPTTPVSFTAFLDSQEHQAFQPAGDEATDDGTLTTVVAGLAAHLADTTDAHDASAVSLVPAYGTTPTDVQTHVTRVMQTMIDLRSYGMAAGASAATNSAAMAEAISDNLPVDGGHFNFPFGPLEFAEPITLVRKRGTRFSGVSQYGTRLYGPGGSDPLFDIQSCRDTRIEHLFLDGGGTTAAIIDSSRLDGSAFSGRNLRVAHCKVGGDSSGNAAYGIRIGTGTDANQDIMHLDDIEFANLGTAVFATSDGVGKNSYLHMFSNLAFSSCDVGIDAIGYSLTNAEFEGTALLFRCRANREHTKITNVSIGDNGSEPKIFDIPADAEDGGTIIFTNCMTGTGMPDPYDVATIDASVNDWLIIFRDFWYQNGGPADATFNIGGTNNTLVFDGGIMLNLKVDNPGGTIVWGAGNKVTALPYAGVELTAARVERFYPDHEFGPALSQTWGKEATVASAAGTITLPAGSLVTVTGTAVITGITATDYDIGRVVALRFTSTAALADSGNLGLNGAFLAVAGTVITLYCDGTNWYEVARSGQFGTHVVNNGGLPQIQSSVSGNAGTITLNGSGATDLTVKSNNGDLLLGNSAGTMTWDNNGPSLFMPDGSKMYPAPSASGRAGFNLQHGAAPSSPENGDMWTTTAGLYVRINGSTVGPLS